MIRFVKAEDDPPPEVVAPAAQAPPPAIAKAAARPAVKASGKPRGKAAGAGTRPDGLTPGTKLALLADTICRPEGATHDELCHVVRWTKCLPMAMKACKDAEITVRRVKEGRVTRYFGTTKVR